jgi:hypothetical protein
MPGFLRFTIRDILWLTVVVALIAGWALDHWRLSRPVGNVGGLVTVNGKPLADGWITFQSASQSFAARVATDGEFSIPFIGAGKYTVAIEGQSVPQRYTAAGPSPLTAEIHAAQNELHFELVSP